MVGCCDSALPMKAIRNLKLKASLLHVCIQLDASPAGLSSKKVKFLQDQRIVDRRTLTLILQRNIPSKQQALAFVASEI